MGPWSIQPLGPAQDRSAFDCGDGVLNEWLKQRAGQWGRKELARCYVGVREPSPLVLGYYAISSHHISFESLPADETRGLPRIDIPVVLLGRLAVDRTVQGQGLGRVLLIDALRRAVYLAGQLGIRAVEVTAGDDRARRFYLKFGFLTLQDDPHHLFLPMHVIRKLHLPPPR